MDDLERKDMAYVQGTPVDRRPSCAQFRLTNNGTGSKVNTMIGGGVQDSHHVHHATSVDDELDRQPNDQPTMQANPGVDNCDGPGKQSSTVVDDQETKKELKIPPSYHSNFAMERWLADRSDFPTYWLASGGMSLEGKPAETKRRS